MKKEVKIVIAVFLAVWLFVMGFEIGGYAEKKKIAETQSTLPTMITTAPTTLDGTTMPSTPADQNTNQDAGTSDSSNSGANDTVDPSTMSKQDVVNKINTYMTQLKSEQNMQIVETALVNINVVDCSVPSVISTINSVISGITGKIDPQTTYVFTNGQGLNGDNEAVTPNDVVPPTSNQFNLSADGVASYKAEKQGDNMVYTVTLVSESTTIENNYPTYHGPTVGYLDIAEFDLPINVTKGDMHYPGATIAITVGGNDKISYIDIKFPMSGEGGTKILGQEGTASFEGALDRTLTITY